MPKLRLISLLAVFIVSFQLSCPPPSPSLVADFSASPAQGAAPLTVEFADSSRLGSAAAIGAQYTWDFGDPASGSENASNEKEPSHTYQVPGHYSVSLTVNLNAQADTKTQNNLIVVTAPPAGPTAAFTASIRNPSPGTPVQFTDTSTPGDANITAWAWDFGDPGSGGANSSTEQNPSHVYAVEGAYSVLLTVTTSIGSDMHTEANFINATTPPVQNAIGDFLDENIPEEEAATAVESALITLAAEAGLEGAVDALQLAMDAEIEGTQELLLLAQRSDALNSRIFDATPLASEKARKGYDPCRRTTVIHINGMNVTYPNFVLNVIALQAAITAEPCLQEEDIVVRGIYQQSATDAQTSFFGGTICPILPGSILFGPRVLSLCQSAGFAFDLAEASQQFLRDWSLFPDLVPNPQELWNLVEIEQEVTRQVVDRKRNVVIVPHSQGNLFTRDVVRNLGEGFGSLGVVEVASPSTTMPGSRVRVDICQDPVSRISTRFSQAACYPWHVPPIGGPLNIAAHDFVSQYLSTAVGATARGGILEAICNYHFTLFNSRIQGSSRPIRLSVADVGISPDHPEGQVELSIGASGDKGIEWATNVDDPRITVSPASGVLVGGAPNPDSTEVATISAVDFGESFVTQVWFINSCYPEVRVPVLVRVNPEGFTTIDFDDITQDQRVEPDRYIKDGVTITSPITLPTPPVDALVRDELWNTPSTFLCVSLGPRCSGPMQFEFSPPVNSPGIYVVDDVSFTNEPFTFEIYDAQGTLIETQEQHEGMRFYVFPFQNVGRLVFRPSETFQGVDTLFFSR